MVSIVGMLALYFIIWWVTLFAVLPFGIRSQWEGKVVPGTEPGAPQRPQLWRKVLITSVISAVIFVIVMFVVNTVTI